MLKLTGHENIDSWDMGHIIAAAIKVMESAAESGNETALDAAKRVLKAAEDVNALRTARNNEDTAYKTALKEALLSKDLDLVINHLTEIRERHIKATKSWINGENVCRLALLEAMMGAEDLKATAAGSGATEGKSEVTLYEALLKALDKLLLPTNENVKGNEVENLYKNYELWARQATPAASPAEAANIAPTDLNTWMVSWEAVSAREAAIVAKKLGWTEKANAAWIAAEKADGAVKKWEMATDPTTQAAAAANAKAAGADAKAAGATALAATVNAQAALANPPVVNATPVNTSTTPRAADAAAAAAGGGASATTAMSVEMEMLAVTREAVGVQGLTDHVPKNAVTKEVAEAWEAAEDAHDAVNAWHMAEDPKTKAEAAANAKAAGLKATAAGVKAIESMKNVHPEVVNQMIEGSMNAQVQWARTKATEVSESVVNARGKDITTTPTAGGGAVVMGAAVGALRGLKSPNTTGSAFTANLNISTLGSGAAAADSKKRIEKDLKHPESKDNETFKPR